MSMERVGDIMRRTVVCDHSDAVLSRVVTSNGDARYLWWCRECSTNVTKLTGRHGGAWLPKQHRDLAGVDLDSLPLAYADTVYRMCQGPCGRVALCELHHWAPRKFFGDNADIWPLGYLCRGCHELWHSRVTPGLCTTWEPALYAAYVLERLGVDQTAELTKHLILLGRRRRGGEAAD